jgi:hypothetical protein
MELQLYMLKSYDNQTISNMTGISINTIAEWRVMMSELENAGIRTKPFIKNSPEKEIQTRFVKTLNQPYQEYVKTKYGIIDVLTDSSIYEMKVEINNSTIHKPVGQILLYSTEMKNRDKIIVAKKIRLNSFIMDSVKNMGIKLLEFS